MNDGEGRRTSFGKMGSSLSRARSRVPEAAGRLDELVVDIRRQGRPGRPEGFRIRRVLLSSRCGSTRNSSSELEDHILPSEYPGKKIE